MRVPTFKQTRQTMTVTGQMLIGQQAGLGTHGHIHGLNAATGEVLQPAFGGLSLIHI